MKTKNHLFPFSVLCLAAFTSLALLSCGGKGKKSYEEIGESGKTVQTENMQENLKTLHTKGVLFGQMYTTLCGVGWEGDSLRSDIKSVCGDFTACTGYEVSDVRSGMDNSGMPLELLRSDILATTRRGGLVLLRWIMPEATDDTDRDDVIASMADFLNSLEDGYGKKSPVVLILMPLGDEEWYVTLSAEEYRTLYSDVEKRLYDLGVVNIVMGCSFSDNETARMPEYLPDDVAVIDFAVQQATSDENTAERWSHLTESLKTFAAYSDNTHVAVGVTMGDYFPKDSTYWSGQVLPFVTSAPLCYALFRENSGTGGNILSACPYPGSPDVSDFMKLYNDKRTLFYHDLNGLYLKTEAKK